MKKNFSLFIVLLSTIIQAQTKDPKTEKITFGFRAGLNLTDLKLNPNSSEFADQEGIYATTTMYGGFFTNFPLNSKISLQPELALAYSDDNFFVEIPLYFNYNFTPKIVGFAGPKISYITESNFNDAIFTTRSAFSFDLGARYWILSKLFVDGTYSLPLTTQKQTYFNPISTVEYSRTELRFGVGYQF